MSITSIVSPHDKIFRASMGNIKVAREYFLQNLPENILAVTDLNSLQLCPQTYVDEELKLSQSDVLYQVKIAEQTGYLYLLCEHQSKSDILMPYRIMKYEINIWTDYLKQNGGHRLPLIVTTVFYNGREPYTHSTDFRDLLNAPKELIEEIWRKPFKLIDAHDITDAKIRENKWFGVLAFFMGHVYARDFLPYLKASMPVLKAIEAENGVNYVVTLINYILSTAETGSIEGFVDIIKEGLSTETSEKTMTIAERLIERGMQKGIQQGMQQGMQQGIQQGMQKGVLEGELRGEKKLLMNLLEIKFGKISTAYLEKIEQADARLVLMWSEKILTANTVDEVFNIYH